MILESRGHSLSYPVLCVRSSDREWMEAETNVRGIEVILISFHFASAFVAVNFSQLMASSSASWRLDKPPSSFVSGHESKIWAMVCCSLLGLDWVVFYIPLLLSAITEWGWGKTPFIHVSTTWALACVILMSWVHIHSVLLVFIKKLQNNFFIWWTKLSLSLQCVLGLLREWLHTTYRTAVLLSVAHVGSSSVQQA